LMPVIKERTLDGHKIIRVGRGQYLAQSRTRPSLHYAVDLQAHDGLGHCECEDFQYRRYPRWKQVKANYDHYRCQHIRAVRNHVLDLIIAHYSDEREES
jgi:hypothetical protein